MQAEGRKGAGWRHPEPLEAIGLGVGLAIVSSTLNGLMAWAMLRKAREVRSVALEGDARHLFTDVWTSAGVVAGLIGVMATGWHSVVTHFGVTITGSLSTRYRRISNEAEPAPMIIAARKVVTGTPLEASSFSTCLRDRRCSLRSDPISPRPPR